MESRISSRMVSVPFFSSLTETFILKVKLSAFFICEYLGNGERQSMRYEVMYLPSLNNAIANVVHRDPDLLFQDHKM